MKARQVGILVAVTLVLSALAGTRLCEAESARSQAHLAGPGPFARLVHRRSTAQQRWKRAAASYFPQ